jgi:hypothetical protein
MAQVLHGHAARESVELVASMPTWRRAQGAPGSRTARHLVVVVPRLVAHRVCRRHSKTCSRDEGLLRTRGIRSAASASIARTAAPVDAETLAAYRAEVP